MELTGRQQEIWTFLVEYVDQHGYPPTVREIGEAVGLASPSTVHAHLANLERAGLLRRDRGHPACKSNSTCTDAESLRPYSVISHSGQRTDGPSCSTNSPHTGHSSEAPRNSASNSCSSVRCRGAT